MSCANWVMFSFSSAVVHYISLSTFVISSSVLRKAKETQTRREPLSHTMDLDCVYSASVLEQKRTTTKTAIKKASEPYSQSVYIGAWANLAYCI